MNYHEAYSGSREVHKVRKVLVKGEIAMLRPFFPPLGIKVLQKWHVSALNTVHK